MSAPQKYFCKHTRELDSHAYNKQELVQTLKKHKGVDTFISLESTTYSHTHIAKRSAASHTPLSCRTRHPRLRSDNDGFYRRAWDGRSSIMMMADIAVTSARTGDDNCGMAADVGPGPVLLRATALNDIVDRTATSTQL